jgi:DNA-directed RNA polymerase specialized sigma24 family protein
MTEIELQKYHVHAFDAFCKRVIKNASIDAKRLYWRNKEISSDDEMLAKYVQSLRTADTYNLRAYEKIFYVNGIKIVVNDEALGEALKYIMPNKRAILLLSYFMNYRDSDIARLLKITSPTVSYRKKQALIQLKLLLEAKHHE